MLAGNINLLIIKKMKGSTVGNGTQDGRDPDHHSCACHSEEFGQESHGNGEQL
jgi:hypothetical protein